MPIENRCAGTISDQLEQGSVMPAKAGIHPIFRWMPAFAGMTTQGKNDLEADSLQFRECGQGGS
jgi:hypothetical protein